MVKKIIETVRGKEYVARYYETTQEALDSIDSHLDCDICIEIIGCCTPEGKEYFLDTRED